MKTDVTAQPKRRQLALGGVFPAQVLASRSNRR